MLGSFVSMIWSGVCLGTVAAWFTKWILPWNENRKELVVLQDPLLQIIPVRDCSTLVSFLSAMHLLWVLITVLQLDFEKVCLHNMALSYLYLFKSTALCLCPLRAPDGGIPIVDTVLRCMMGGQHFIHDMMFSGHLGHSTIISMLINSSSYIWYLKPILLTYCLLRSRSHYTIDLIVSVAAAHLSLHCAKNSYVC